MKLFLKFSLFLSLVFVFSCATVPPGNKGVEVSWGGETNMDKIYDEGMSGGLHWIWDDMVEYDCRVQDLISDFEFNDKNNMLTGVEIAVFWNYDPATVNKLHKTLKDVPDQLKATIKSAAKEVIPQYTASELNLSHRAEAEEALGKILSEELPALLCQFSRIQITDVDIPGAISTLAEQTAAQIEKNKLAAQKKAEQEGLAAANVAEAKGKFEAAEFNSKAAALLSQPAMLKLKQLDVEMEWAKKGVSPYGSNNVFGGNVPVIRMQGN